jgi:hypothetical protein
LQKQKQKLWQALSSYFVYMAAGDGELAPLAACLVAAHLADPAAAERRDAETDH